MLKDKYGDSHPFPKFIFSTLEFMKLVRNLRNALDHRLNSVKVYDFELQANSNVLTPCIELNHRGSKLEKEALSELLQNLVPNLVYVIESTIALVGNHTTTGAYMIEGVREIPVDRRKYKHVKYAFWIPFGKDGQFYQ